MPAHTANRMITFHRLSVTQRQWLKPPEGKGDIHSRERPWASDEQQGSLAAACWRPKKLVAGAPPSSTSSSSSPVSSEPLSYHRDHHQYRHHLQLHHHHLHHLHQRLYLRLLHHQHLHNLYLYLQLYHHRHTHHFLHRHLQLNHLHVFITITAIMTTLS